MRTVRIHVFTENPSRATKKVLEIRVGDYRVFAQIRDGVLLILILEVGHRSTVYDR